MSGSTLLARRRGARVGGIAAVAGLLTVLWAPAAHAAPALTIPLEPPVVMVAPYPVENFGPLTLAGLDAETYAPVQVQWGGTVVIEFDPTKIDGSAMEVTVGLAPTDEDPPAVEFSTENSPPDLTVTPGGPGQYTITMPPADPANPVGYLTVDGLAPAAGIDGVDVMPADYLLALDASYPASQNLAPDLFAVAAAPCSTSSTSCPERTLTAGQSFALTVPPSSVLRQLGLGRFDDVSMTLEPVTGERTIELAAAAAGVAAAAPAAAGGPVSPVVEAMTEARGAATAADAQTLDLSAAAVGTTASSYSATATVPAGVEAGDYMLTVLDAGASGGASMTMLDMEIAAPRVINAGLRSDTGWDEPFVMTSSPGAPLVALGGGLLLIAGLGTVAALQGRRTAAE